MDSFEAPNTNRQNGAFLESLTAEAGDTALGQAATAVSASYFSDGKVAFGLKLIKDEHIVQLTDYWRNAALDDLTVSLEADGFNDTTSNAKKRSAQDYLSSTAIFADSELNSDPRFPGKRPTGFEIKMSEQPVMALVALDPMRLDPSLTPADKLSLLEEVKNLRILATSPDQAARDAAALTMSPALRQALASTLLINNSYTGDQISNAEAWNLPFDLIASLKACYTLLSGEATSGSMRQGAVREMSDSGQQIIVGCSGLNSAIDEMVARNFAQDVLAITTD